MRLPNWYRVESDGLRFYRAWHLHASGLVSHGFSTRMGGSSVEPYDTLNLGLHVEDDAESVLRNRQAYAAALGVDHQAIIVPGQVHSNQVKRVGKADLGLGALDQGQVVADTDALITNEPGVCLSLHFADCVSIFFLDPVNKAIGVAHAGWRGTAERIVTETVLAMREEFGTDPGQLLAAIGPSICRSCYCVGPDTALILFKAFPHDERVLKQASTDTWHADLKTANLILLKDAGVLDANIAVSESCTCCDHDEFFSYRRDGKTGRMGGWMSIVG